MRLQLIRVHEDGTCAKWRTDRDDLAVVLIIPARPRMPFRGNAARSPPPAGASPPSGA